MDNETPVKRGPGRPSRQTEDVIPQTEHAKELAKKASNRKKYNELKEEWYEKQGDKLVHIIRNTQGKYGRFVFKFAKEKGKVRKAQEEFVAKLTKQGKFR